jgi:hypothetical protein
MGNGQKKEGKGTEEGWEWDKRKMGMGRKRMGMKQKKDRNGAEEGWEWGGIKLERTEERWEWEIRKIVPRIGHKKDRKGRRRMVRDRIIEKGTEAAWERDGRTMEKGTE